jgi:hypothetical protein
MSTSERLANLAQHPVVKTLQSDANEATWRIAGSQLLKLTREPLVALLSRHLGPEDESMRRRVATFLETDLGSSLLAAALSMGLSAMPASAGEAPQKLGRELRIRSMAGVGDIVAEVITGPLRQVMAYYIKDMENAPAPSSPAELTEGHLGALATGDIQHQSAKA